MNKPDCCDEMRMHLRREDRVRFSVSDAWPDDFFDLGVNGLDKGIAAAWIATGYESGYYGDVRWEWTRIRYCPWCGQAIDERERLE